ncbi:alpha/beta fold hydrolase [Kineococcus arenarius]|uniref:alpha/beta fold hydrolase n=1 Tax=Kineococcus sp. SYSU DK007 TaxID=3383128 RepID=UPI003D7E3A5D
MRLVLLDPRGAGRSAVPADTTSYRCDHLVDEVEALRVHTDLERVDVLAHSAGSGVGAVTGAPSSAANRRCP